MVAAKVRFCAGLLGCFIANGARPSELLSRKASPAMQMVSVVLLDSLLLRDGGRKAEPSFEDGTVCSLSNILVKNFGYNENRRPGLTPSSGSQPHSLRLAFGVRSLTTVLDPII